MKEVRVNLKGEAYSIYIGQGILNRLGVVLNRYKFSRKMAIVTNSIVNQLYGAALKDDLEAAGFEVLTIEIPDGESYKSLETAWTVYDKLIENRLDRRSAILALGGGVVGDLAGFVAATYLRGVPFIQIPTSLLAQVDSSVGGKVAVNHPMGKNMIGAFYQPKLVWTDLRTLKSLPQREFKSGLAEVVKYGVIADREFFKYLEKNTSRIMDLDLNALTKIVTRACTIKARVVEQDEKEKGLRMILNYGHTIGHALEMLTNFSVYKHGEAVAIGMMTAAKIAYKQGLLNKGALVRQENLLRQIGLPTLIEEKVEIEEILTALLRDKKVVNNKIRFVLPKELGKVIITDRVPSHVVHEALTEQLLMGQ